MNCKTALIATFSIALSGCADIGTAPATDGQASGGAPAAAAQTTAAVITPLQEFIKARQSEDALVDRTRQAITATIPQTYSVQTKAYNVTDNTTQKRQRVTTFDRLYMIAPANLAKKPNSAETNAALNALADSLADSRGQAKITYSINPVDARSQKIALQASIRKTLRGNIVAITYMADSHMRRELQAISVEAGALDATDFKRITGSAYTVAPIALRPVVRNYACSKTVKFTIEFFNDDSDLRTDTATITIAGRKQESLNREMANSGAYSNSRIAFDEPSYGNNIDLTLTTDNGKAAKYTCK